MNDDVNRKKHNTIEGITRISAETLAGFIVDALIQAKIMQKTDAKKAIDIATEEINVSKAIGECD